MKLYFLLLALACVAFAQGYVRTYDRWVFYKLIAWIIIMILLLSISHTVFRVLVKNEAELNRLSVLQPNYDFWIQPRLGYVDIMARPDQHLELFLKGHEYEYTIHIPDVGK